MTKKYDYLIVGSGLFGSTLAYKLKKQGKSVLIIEKRSHIGGNIYTENVDGINVHKYGAHIFHTSNKEVWDFINQFAEFNNYINSPIAIYKNKIYNMPFNMNTFSKLWGTKTPLEAKIYLNKHKAEIKEPKNLEEQAKKLVGNKLYKTLIKGYTEKQWGKKCKDLPAFIINRIPLRFEYNNNYFNDKYQGIPIGGYTNIIKKMLKGIKVKLNCDYIKNKEKYNKMAKTIIITAPIDEYYNYCYGELEYRSLKFEEYLIKTSNYQGNAVVNYTDKKVPYTRIIEHKFFENMQTDKTIITKEYPKKWEKGEDAYYPINDKKNNELYNKYKKLNSKENNIIFAGRLGCYKYYDMDDTIEEAIKLADKLLSTK